MEKIIDFEKLNLSISTTPINALELFKGAFRSSRARENAKIVEELLRNVMLLEIDLTSAKIFGEETERLRKAGKPIGEFDIIIASTVLAHDEVLVTKNTQHLQKIPMLRIESW
ncbi:MAG: type II toxin-antitoxin system VapC family toxin [Candidatus Thermoplasmatota archaeon]|nr:type II toxin-antitoxin system VapC family toxin [Candidatus Thermoplasmatota archaeon]